MLPDNLHKFFWEYDTRTLDKDTDWYQIIERILEYGSLDANRWIYHSYTEGQIAEVVKNSRKLSKRTALLWQNLIGVSKEEVLCLKTSCQPSDIPFLNS